MVLIYKDSFADIAVEELKTADVNELSKSIEIDRRNVHYRDDGKGF
ncbi:hypothetical protein [Polaribacter sp. SA4-10]|nr:hypothetical protein [Polaribacter sp. SA4-10]